MADKKTTFKQFRRKKSKPKKPKAQLDEERRQREAERARRDAEKAKKRLTLRSKIQNVKTKKQQNTEPQTPNTTATIAKEQRKKVLRFRRAQSRFDLPKINLDDTLEDIARANAELEAAINDTNHQNNTQTNDNDDEKKQIDDNTEDTQSIVSVTELTLSNQQENDLHKLTDALESADPDYYGFVDFKKFINILKQNDIDLSAKHETFIMGALTLIDEGVDYYDFVRKIREVGRTLQPDNTLKDICEEIAETVEKEREKKTELPSTNLDDIGSKDIVNVDEDEFAVFFAQAMELRGRGMSLARMKSASDNVNKSTKLGELIDDLALDGAEIDFALLKMSLSTIDCNPPDKDLHYLINHLCNDGSGFIDFNYLITFLQETSGIPANKWTRIENIINKVVNQLRMVERAELRKKQQSAKLKQRLEKRRVSRQPKKDDEMAQLEAEEKRLRTLRLRDKAKNLKK